VRDIFGYWAAIESDAPRAAITSILTTVPDAVIQTHLIRFKTDPAFRRLEELRRALLPPEPIAL